MKTRIPKVMGVVLTLILLASFLVFAVPTSAADLAWSSLPVPSTSGNSIAAGTDVGDITVASDGTQFVAEGLRVLKSIDGGYNWAPGVFPGGTVAIVHVVLSPNYATDQTVFAHDGARVYRSANGGANYAVLGSPLLAGTEIITSLAVAPNYSAGGVIAIGVAEPAPGVPATSGVWLWGYGGVLAWAQWSPTGVLAEDVTAVAFSKNYPMDSTVLAIGSTVATGTWIHTCAGTNAWDATIMGGAGPLAINAAILDMGNVGIAIQTSDMALPSNYNATDPTTIRAFVSLIDDGGAAITANSNVYMCTGVSTVTPLNPPDSDNVTIGAQRAYSDLEYSGDFTSGTLFAGRYANVVGVTANVARCTNPQAPVPLWYNATNRPSGVATAAGPECNIALATDFATSNMMYVASEGTDSACGYSPNGAVTFNERGMIDTPVQTVVPFVADIQPAPDYETSKTAFLATVSAAIGTGDALNDSCWMTTDGGNHWERVHWMVTTNDSAIVRPSNEYPTNSTVYYAETGAGAVNLIYSANAGVTWSGRVSPIAIGDVGAADATNVYVALNAGGSVVKSPNAGWTWPPQVATGAAVINDLTVVGSDLVVGSTAGTVRRSADANVTWAPVGATIGGGGNVWVDFDGTTIYAMEAAGGLFSFEPGVSIAWSSLDTTAGAGSGISMADDSTLYGADPTAAAAAAGGVRRSINVDDFEWIGTDGTGVVTGTALPNAGATLNAMAEADNYLLCIDRSPVPDDRILIFTDTLSNRMGGVTLNAPADGDITGNQRWVTWVWDEVDGVDQYDLQYASRADFSNAVLRVTAAPGYADTFQLPADIPYNWRVRVSTGQPLVSPWSEARVVNPQLTTGVNAPAPIQPVGITAINTSINPVFNWGALKWATSYKFQLASDAAFSDTLVDATLGNVTSYAYTEGLDYEGTYYWRVKGISATSSTDWSAGTGFTTMAEPEPPVVVEETQPPQIVIPPAETTEITPGWIYAIIAVGAILVIAVIVLIVRTRRVP